MREAALEVDEESNLAKETPEFSTDATKGEEHVGNGVQATYHNQS